MNGLRLPKQHARVLGDSIEYTLLGQGRPLLLINGSGGPIEGWFRVIEPLAQMGTVLAYNRSGVGRSAAPACAMTAARSVAVLHALRGQLGLAEPALLIGHSMGGLIANLYARCHPEATAGLLLLEATAPQDVALLARLESPLQRLARRLLNRLWPPHVHDETGHLPQSLAELAAAPGFPPLPLRVISGGRPALAWATPAAAIAGRAAHQALLARLSPLGEQTVAQRSGHFPQLSEPALVLDAVRELARLAGVGGQAPGGRR